MCARPVIHDFRTSTAGIVPTSGKNLILADATNIHTDRSELAKLNEDLTGAVILRDANPTGMDEGLIDELKRVILPVMKDEGFPFLEMSIPPQESVPENLSNPSGMTKFVERVWGSPLSGELTHLSRSYTDVYNRTMHVADLRKEGLTIAYYPEKKLLKWHDDDLRDETGKRTSKYGEHRSILWSPDKHGTEFAVRFAATDNNDSQFTTYSVDEIAQTGKGLAVFKRAGDHRVVHRSNPRGDSFTLMMWRAAPK